MALELTLMTVSGIVMVSLLVHKHLELSKGLETRAQGVREKADPILHNIRHEAGKTFSYLTWHNTALWLNFVFVKVVRFFMDMSHKAHKASSNLVEKASKKTEDLSKAGSASFYLKQIKEDKDALSAGNLTTPAEAGKIE